MSLSLMDPYFIVTVELPDQSEAVFASSATVPAVVAPMVPAQMVASIEIEQTLAGNGNIKIELTPTYEDAMALLDSSVLGLGNVVKVKWGYGSPAGAGFGPMFREAVGIMVLPDVTLGHEISITINAFGYGRTMQNDERRKTWRAENDPNSSILSLDEIIKKLSVIYGWADPEIENDEKFRKIPQTPFVQSGETDFEFLRKTTQLYGGEMAVVTDQKTGKPQIKIVDVRKRLDGDEHVPMVTLQMYAQIAVNFSDGVFPILSFSTESGGLMIAGASRGVCLQQVSDTNSPVVTTEIDPKTVTGGKGSAQYDLSGAKETPVGKISKAPVSLAHTNGADGRTCGKHMSFPVDPKFVEQRLSAEMNRATTLQNIQITVTTLGLPFLQPGEAVSVRLSRFTAKTSQVQTMFDGKYLIYRASHKLGGNGYEVELTCVRSGLAIEGPMTTKVDALAKADGPKAEVASNDDKTVEAV